MGVLHGDPDRDFKDTNLHILSRDVAQLHEEMKELFAQLSKKVDDETQEIDVNLARETTEIDTLVTNLTQLTQSETDAIDAALNALSTQVNTETQGVR